jgi:hypothetical protein
MKVKLEQYLLQQLALLSKEMTKNESIYAVGSKVI